MARTTVASAAPPQDATAPPSSRPAADPAAASSGGLPHLPALDGLRGLAVGVVVLFHGGFSWMTGGYLGVSTFFTLSGFLITALLLVERTRTGSVDLRHFWTRRFRRLMPAALATLGLATLFGMTVADAVQRRNLAGDVTASLLEVANWRFIFSGQAYADLFGAPSPVLHFWSLAIEEQFYLLYPLLAWFAFRILKVSRPVFAVVLAALIAVSVSVTLFAGFTPDRIYLGTDTRSAEVLVGALLATLIYHRPVTAALTRRTRVRPVVAGAGAVALATCAVMWVTVPQETSWLYRGGFPAYAVLSALVVLAAIVPAGPVQWLLSLSGLRALGRISYGVYLYHWPVFLWLSPERTGWSDAPLLVPRLAVTFALALVSFHLLETPVRRGSLLAGIRPVRLVPVVAGALVVSTLVITLDAPAPVIDFDEAAAQLETMAVVPEVVGPMDPSATDDGSATAAPTPPPPPVTVLGTPPRPRIAMFGDSTAMMTVTGLFLLNQATDRVDYVRGDPLPGCSIGRGGEYRSGSEYGFVSDECNERDARWADRIATGKPNVAVVQIGPWDVGDRRLPGDDTWRAMGDPVYDAFLLDEMTHAIDVLSVDGAQVLWLSAPPVGGGSLGDGQAIRGVAAIPERTARLNELIDQLPTLRPGKVTVVDLAGWLQSTGEDVRLRPDGVHFSKETSIEVAQRWLEQALIDAFDEAWTTNERDRLAQVNAARKRVLVLGDPSAAGVADALATWGASSGLVEVVTIGQPPCGVLRTTGRRGPLGVEPTPIDCDQLQYGWMQSAVAADADAIVVSPSVWDLTDVSFDDGPLVAAGDAAYDERATAELTELNRALARAAPAVVWLAPPALTWHAADGSPRVAVADVARTAAYAQVLGATVEAVPGTAVVDLSTLLAQPVQLTGDPASTVDGFALDAGSTAQLGERLGPVLVGG
jgi:peptidoglycan/LPS O-acetylase OafA/YrhL